MGESIQNISTEFESPKQKRKQRNKINLLPIHIKTELLRLIAQGHGSQTCHKLIQDKFGSDPLYIPFSRRTLQSFMTSNQGTIQSHQMPDSGSPGQVNPGNYHGLVLSQFQSFTRLLDQMQSSADRSDPKFNDELIRVQKEWRSLLELVYKLQEQQQDHKTDEELERLLRRNEYYLMTSVQHAYDEVHGNEKKEAFKNALIKQLLIQTENFKKTYEIKGA